MKKLLVIAGIVVGVGLVGGLALAFFLGSIVTAGVNKFAPQITQTKVVLESARISPLTGSGTLAGLVVANPKGWSDNNLCALGKIHVSVAPFSLLGDHIVVNEIVIDAPEFNYETKLVASNVGDLLKNIEAATGGKGPSGAAAPQTKEGKPIKFEVKKFTLTNGKVRLGVGGAGATLPMPGIELTDLGTKEGGITPDQLAFAVMKSVTGSIVSATAKAMGDIGKTGGATAVEGVKKAGDAIKGLFGGDKKKP
ncbi:MAG: hypothetical protein HZC55_15720 [Verrucomicrobia bacterium]|nr:hypothetical protein [Verrucomicrobiota bacterium]